MEQDPKDSDEPKITSKRGVRPPAALFVEPANTGKADDDASSADTPPAGDAPRPSAGTPAKRAAPGSPIQPATTDPATATRTPKPRTKPAPAKFAAAPTPDVEADLPKPAAARRKPTTDTPFSTPAISKATQRPAKIPAAATDKPVPGERPADAKPSASAARGTKSAPDQRARDEAAAATAGKPAMPADKPAGPADKPAASAVEPVKRAPETQRQAAKATSKEAPAKATPVKKTPVRKATPKPIAEAPDTSASERSRDEVIVSVEPTQTVIMPVASAHSPAAPASPVEPASVPEPGTPAVTSEITAVEAPVTAEPADGTAEAAGQEGDRATAHAAPVTHPVPSPQDAEVASTGETRTEEITSADLWAAVKAEPRRAPGVLALAFIDRYAPDAQRQASWLAETYPGVAAERLALLAARNASRRTRFATMAGAPFAGLVRLPLLALAQGRLVLEVAAIFGRDPVDPQRAAEMLTLLGVYPDVEQAASAVAAATDELRETPLPRIRGRVAGLLLARRMLRRLWPGAGLLIDGLTAANSTDDLAVRTIRFYLGSKAG